MVYILVVVLRMYTLLMQIPMYTLVKKVLLKLRNCLLGSSSVPRQLCLSDIASMPTHQKLIDL